jgi:chromosome segregation ATPase
MPMAAPGTYTVSLFKEIDGVVTPLSEPVSFKVKQLQKGALEGSSPEETVAFWKDIQQMQGKISATSLDLNHALKKVNGMELALARTELQPGELDKALSELRQKVSEIEGRLNGNHSKNEIGEKNNPTIKSRLNAASNGVQNATYGPTETAQRSLEIAEREYDLLKKELDDLINERIPTLEMQLKEAGAPEIKG